MTVDRVNLKITNERHQRYRDAFSISNKSYYYNLLSSFLDDPDLSPSNSDDLELFNDLIFQGKLGRVHLDYGNWLCDMIVNHKVESKTLLDNYINYLGRLSAIYTADFFHSILCDFDEDYIPIILKKLSTPCALAIAKIAASQYPKVFHSMPKLKTYLIFS